MKVFLPHSFSWHLSAMNKWNEQHWRGLGWLLMCTLDEETPLSLVCCGSWWTLSVYSKHSLFQLVFPTASSRAWSSPRCSSWQDPRRAPWELVLKLCLQQYHHEVVRAASKVILHREVPLWLWAIKSRVNFKCWKQVEKREGESYGKPFAWFQFFTSFSHFFVWDGLSSVESTLHVVLSLYSHLLFKLL